MTHFHTIFLLGITAMSVMASGSAFASEQYPINYPNDTTVADRGRYITSLLLTSTNDGVQEAPVNQGKDLLLYHDVTHYCFSAVGGETVIPSFDWTGSWMHGYIYLDRDNDGEFNALTGPGGAIPEGSDVMAYSSYDGYNSVGSATENGNVGIYPPSFVMPELPTGLYRMRYKIDWSSIDPGGNPGNAEGNNTIIKNGGGIADVMVYIHEKESGIEVESEHGRVCDYDGVDIVEAGIIPGEDFGLMIIPDDGYSVTGITIESGYDVDLPDGVEFALPDLLRKSNVLPPYLIVNNEVEVPASYTYGKIKIIVNYAEKSGDDLEDYACTLSGTKKQPEGFMNITINSGANGMISSTAAVNSTKRHYFYEKSVLHAVKGNEIVPSFKFGQGGPTTVNFYIDLNQDGAFSEEMGEKLSTCMSDGQLPAFTLPTTVATGVYRARMEAEDVAVVDFLFNYHNAEGVVRLDVKNGFVTGTAGRDLAATVAYGANSVYVTPKATLPGFEASSVVVRHGHNLTRSQYIRGNKQWSEIEVPVGVATKIDAANVDGDILILGNFEPTGDCEWQPVWSDEFDGKKLDTQKWSYHPRYSSVWNRFIAVGNECPVVNVVADGEYTAYCMPTPDEFKATEKNPMISGAIYTSGKFYCTGGWIEARAKTTPHTGNFPAFWMMPVTPETWPNAGEIDIWEQINTENIAHHTIHSAWANLTLGKPDQNSPAKGGSANVTSSQWHVYALEWDQDAMKFYVDGVLNFTYQNLGYSDSNYSEYHAWPFSKPFYIICNQSVGNGSWAAAADETFTYHTEFDYVRVYQKKDTLDYYSTADGYVKSEPGGITDIVISGNDGFDPNLPSVYYNLQGIQVDADRLAPGIYIRTQGNLASKVLIK